MEKKIKFLVVGLLGIVLIFIFLYAQTLNSKQILTKERDQLKSENASLNEKVQKFSVELREKKQENDSLKSDLDKNKRDIAELQNRYDEAVKAKDELVEKIKTMQQTPAQQATAQMAPEQAEAYWADILKAKTDLGMQLESVRNELRSLQINNEQLQREKASLGLEIEGLNREKSDLKRQIEYNKKVMDSIAQELVRERSDKLKIEEGFAPIKSENAALTRQLNGLNDKKIGLEKKISLVQQEKKALENKLSEMETMLIDKISQINGLKNQLEGIRNVGTSEAGAPAPAAAVTEKKDTVELSPIVVRPQDNQVVSKEETKMAPPSGTILTVNRDSNFVIIDSGEDAGVKTGDNFKVYRAGENIATIKVIKSSKSVAACDIEQENKPVKIGDMIR